jgi:hypothetical protein
MHREVGDTSFYTLSDPKEGFDVLVRDALILLQNTLEYLSIRIRQYDHGGLFIGGRIASGMLKKQVSLTLPRDKSTYNYTGRQGITNVHVSNAGMNVDCEGLTPVHEYLFELLPMGAARINPRKGNEISVGAIWHGPTCS